MAVMRADSKLDPGKSIIHETFHLLGLSDRYTDTYLNGKRVSTIHEGFETDIMGGGQNKDVIATMKQTHWNNYQNYIQTNPQVRQQLNQNPNQFYLKNRVDITGPAGNKKLLNN